MRVICALLALLVVGAYAQDNFYSHVAGGAFTRGAPISVPNGFARFDTTTMQWFATASNFGLGGNPSIVDIEASGNDIVFLLTRDNTADRVVQYTISTQQFVVLGDEFASGELNDIAIIGDRLYVCGGFTLRRPFNDQITPAPRPNVINIGYLPVASTENRLLWNQVTPPTDIAQGTSPVCNRIFGFGDRLVIASGTSMWWRNAADGIWTNDPTNAASGVSNLRMAAGPANSPAVLVGSTFVDGATLYISAPAGQNYRLEPDTTSDYRIVSTTNGVTYAPALRIDEVTLNNDPRRFSAGDLSNFAVVGGQTYFPMTRINGTRQYWAIFRAAVGGALAIPARVGDANTYFGDGSNQGNAPAITSFGGQSGFIVDGTKVVFRTSTGVPVVYVESVYADSENDPDLVLFRKSTRMSDWNSFETSTGVFATELGGGSGGVTKAIKVDTTYLVIGGFNQVWNKRWLGLAGYNENKKEWTPLGNPLSDWLATPRAIDSATSPVAGAALSGTPSIDVVHHFPAGINNAHYVIVAGNFRRINNATMNGIAWMRTDEPNTWNALGSIGLHANSGDLDYVHYRSAGISTYVRPAKINTIVSTAGKGRGGKTLWIGGSFIGSGASRSDVPLHNVAKYAFGDENDKVFTALGGGVNSEVLALDASGNQVYVGGAITKAGNITVNNIAHWDDDKKVWNSMQTGVAGTVQQIIARSPSEVYVLAGSHAGGVVSRNNVHRWDGQKWTFIECDICNIGCEIRNTPSACSDQAAELRWIGNRLYRRTTSGAIQFWDNSRWRTLEQSNIAVAGTAQRNWLSRGLTGDRFLVANSNNGLASDYSPQLAEVSLDVNENNVYPVAGAGFNSAIVQLSPAATVAPVMIFVAAIVLAVMLF